MFIESRAKEPIVPLDLWKDRTYASSIIATFLVSIGFFGAAVFLPQWFQFVQGATPTNSGLYTLALLAGLIISSVGSGILVVAGPASTSRSSWPASPSWPSACT